MRNYYQILGVKPGDSQDQIKKAYRKLAKIYHPDTGGNKSDEEKFKDINEAYQTLGNSESKTDYDKKWHFDEDRAYSNTNNKMSYAKTPKSNASPKYKPYAKKSGAQQTGYQRAQSNTTPNHSSYASKNSTQQQTQQSNASYQYSQQNVPTNNKVKIVILYILEMVSAFIDFLLINVLLPTATILLSLLTGYCLILYFFAATAGSLPVESFLESFPFLKLPLVIVICGWILFAIIRFVILTMIDNKLKSLK